MLSNDVGLVLFRGGFEVVGDDAGEDEMAAVQNLGRSLWRKTQVDITQKTCGFVKLN